MKNCPNCKAEVEDVFELCWNCNYSFTAKEIVNIKEIARAGDRELECLRCGTPMMFTKTYKFHEGARTGIWGAIGELAVNRETFDLYLCPRCGKVEFFAPLAGK